MTDQIFSAKNFFNVEIIPQEFWKDPIDCDKQCISNSRHICPWSVVFSKPLEKLNLNFVIN